MSPIKFPESLIYHLKGGSHHVGALDRLDQACTR